MSQRVRFAPLFIPIIIGTVSRCFDYVIDNPDSYRDCKRQARQNESFGLAKISRTDNMFWKAYGIYLGRYLRFNSWDLVSDPFNLARQMFYSVFSQNCYKETLSVTITFTIFLYLVFEILASLKSAVNTQQNELS